MQCGCPASSLYLASRVSHPSALWTCLTLSACTRATPDTGACSQAWLSNVPSSPDHADSRQTTRCLIARTHILMCILTFRKHMLETSEMIWKRAPTCYAFLALGHFTVSVTAISFLYLWWCGLVRATQQVLGILWGIKVGDRQRPVALAVQQTGVGGLLSPSSLILCFSASSPHANPRHCFLSPVISYSLVYSDL